MKIDWVKSWFLMVSSHSSHTATHTASFAPLYLFLTSLKHLPCRRPSFFFSPLLRFFSFSFPSVALPRTRSARAASTASAVTTKLLSGRGAKTTPTDVVEASWVRKTPEKIAQKQGTEQLSEWATQMVGFGHGGNCGLRGGLACAQALDNFKRHQSDSLIPRGDKFKKELTSVPQILIVMCILVYWYRMIFLVDQNGLEWHLALWVISLISLISLISIGWFPKTHLRNREDLQAAQRRCLCLGLQSLRRDPGQPGRDQNSENFKKMRKMSKYLYNSM